MTTVFLGDMITIMVSNDGSDDGGAGRDEWDFDTGEDYANPKLY